MECLKFLPLALSLTLFFDAQCFAKQARCEGLTENISHTDVFSLSNGDIFELPVIAHDFDFVSFVGWLDLEKLAVILQKDNLYPLAFHGRALGAISAYKYQKTSEGQFNELYFTAFASSQASQNTFASIVELLKNIRFVATAPNPDVSLYHLNSYSNNESWHLASEEIWGIPSELAEIEINIENNQQGFTLRENNKSILQALVSKQIKTPNFFGGDVHLYASAGGKASGRVKYSPVEACGQTRIGFLNNKNVFRISSLEENRAPAHPLIVNLKELNFEPLLVQVGNNLQAIQYAPL